jgi:NADH dehydrogenase
MTGSKNADQQTAEQHSGKGTVVTTHAPAPLGTDAQAAHGHDEAVPGAARQAAAPDRTDPPPMTDRPSALAHANHDREADVPTVVVVGAGFGGLSAIRDLAGARVRIVVVDQRNHHLFQPLLYQVATAALSPADITAPIRSIVGRRDNVTVVLGEVFAIDTGRRVVGVRDTSIRQIGYDYLVVATGSRNSYFGHDEWARTSSGLKTIEDAAYIRRQILLAFERAENEQDPEEKERLLTFVVIGGGPTGVEMAGAISELARRILAPDFHTINSRSARVILVEAGPRLLPSFAQDLSDYAVRSLQRLGVEVRTGSRVTAIEPHCVVLQTDRIETRTAIWAAGVRASDAANWLSAEADRAGRVKVNADLTLPGHPEVFVIGDTALVLDGKGRPVPGLAPAAKEQGHYVAQSLRARLKGRKIGPFKYRHYGSLATIGRRSAVIEFGRLHLRGFLAWLLWGIAHIFFLIGFRNRIVVIIDWLWAYLWYRGGARLITDINRDGIADPAAGSHPVEIQGADGERTLTNPGSPKPAWSEAPDKGDRTA